MLKIAICDDVAEDRIRVAEMVDEYLRENGIVARVFKYEHPDAMLTACETFRPQLYILDIVMPMITGIEAAREIRWHQKDSQFIFATSEPSYALESFDVNPINYIVKPVSKEKLFSTMDLALKHIDIAEEKSITIKVKGGLSSIILNEIMYIEYRNHTANYVLLDGSVITTTTFRVGFKEYLKQNHAEGNIVQCHESFAVNLGAITKLSKTEIILRKNEVIPVSKSRYPEVADRYLNYRFD